MDLNEMKVGDARELVETIASFSALLSAATLHIVYCEDAGDHDEDLVTLTLESLGYDERQPDLFWTIPRSVAYAEVKSMIEGVLEALESTQQEVPK